MKDVHLNRAHVPKGEEDMSSLSGDHIRLHMYNFTDGALKVLKWARDAAWHFRCEYVGAEHLLLGLLQDGEGVGIEVLREFQVDPWEVEKKVRALVTEGRATEFDSLTLLTSRAKKVLDLAWAEAREMGHSHLGREHILLGLLAEGKGIPAQVLLASGVTLERARTEVRRLIAGA